MGDQIALCCTRMRREECKHFTVHVCDVMGAVAQESVLQGAVFMHDGVHEVEQIIRGIFHCVSQQAEKEQIVDIVSLYL
jgi:hypothetical protein